MNTRLLLSVICAICAIGSTQAQDKLEGSLKADFVSTYIWRGQHLGHVSIQPELSVTWKGLGLTAWGNVGLSNYKDLREIDLTLSYDTGGLSFGIVDYWNNEYDSRFFYYRKDGTGHVFEGYVSYDFGPVGISWQTFFAGNDYQKDSGRRAWSSYFEVSAPFRLVTCQWEATAGLVPWACDYYDTKGFSVTNLSLQATKPIQLSRSFALPLFGKLIANPASQDLWFVVGFTLKAF